MTDQHPILTAATGLIAARAPYLLRAVRLLDLDMTETADHHTSTATARVRLAENLCLADTDAETTRRTATTILTALWRVARFHHERGEHYAGSRDAWETASSVMCFRDAVDCLSPRHATTDITMPAEFTTTGDLNTLAHTAMRRVTDTPEWWAQLIDDEKQPVTPLFRVPDDTDEATAPPSVTATRAGQARARRVRTAMTEGIAQAMSMSGAGALPLSVQEWNESHAKTNPLNIAEHSRFRVTQALSTHSRYFQPTYRRRSRRDTGGDLVLPAYTTAGARILAAVDVSGSMSDETLRYAVGVVAQLARETDHGLSYFSVSNTTHSLRDYTTCGIRIDRDRAGTDMRVAWEVFNDHPDDMPVVITDGKTPWPTSAGDAVVVIVADTAEDYRRVVESVPHDAVTMWVPAGSATGRL